MPTADPSSNANYDEVALEHLDLDLKVDFDAKTLSTTATWHARVVAKGQVPAVVLDTKKVRVLAVKVDGANAQHSLEGDDDVFGTKLVVKLPAQAGKQGSRFLLDIASEAGRECSAAQWLSPEQTAGKAHPYFFTQCQAIHARALLPCHDGPSAKFTYNATVRVPGWATALMSAKRLGVQESPEGRIATFQQTTRIPSYLLAIAVGDLQGRSISPRSTVWAEPSMVAAVQAEFGADTELFLRCAEEITGEPYAWEVYDILCLPPSFPYGGMENPCLTFCTPTLLAGDRSLVGVIAHEIAHSWTGNLITNASWEHFWLNEGWTVWLERHMLAKAYDQPKLVDLHALTGLKALHDDVVQHLGERNPLTRLVPDLSGGTDPDDAFSRVPYEKGFNLLCVIADAMGGGDIFGGFVMAYVQKFKGHTVTSPEFRDFVERWTKDKGIDMKGAVDWDAWFFSPGMPPTTRKFDTSMADVCATLAARWAAGETESCSSEDVEGWSSLQRQMFLSDLQDKVASAGGDAPVAHKVEDASLKRMGQLYGFGAGRPGQPVNCEEAFRFYLLCLTTGAAFATPAILEFVKSNGRMKYVRPLYRALYARKDTRDDALRTFEAWRGNYHPIAQHMLALDLSIRA